MGIYNTKEIYDWVIVGGGISGIAVAEILCRENKSVILIEKNEKLASETSKVFHEWFHSGALYTLDSKNNTTIRYLLGAVDDLLEYYQSFANMNLLPSEAGINLSGGGWFNDEKIEFRYRVRKFNPAWLGLVSRSISMIDLISRHDWLRRRAGSELGSSRVKLGNWYNNIHRQFMEPSKFLSKKTADVTINSRILISDLISTAVKNGLKILTSTAVKTIDSDGNLVRLMTDNNTLKTKNVVICSCDTITEILNVPIKTGYAPIAVVENVPKEENSFVELDYYTKNCINLIKKIDGIGQIGGITLKKKEDVNSYLNYIISEHEKRNPGIKVLDSYIGLKKELIQKGKSRNYLYNITQHSSKIWSVVLGKFSLAFSMAPEFYRRVYHKNPSKFIQTFKDSNYNKLVSETSWQEIVRKTKNG